MVGGHRVGSLSLIALRLVAVDVRDVGGVERSTLRLVLEPARSEEPQTIFHDWPSDRVLVRGNRLRHAQLFVRRIGGDRRLFEGRERSPLVIVVRVSERTAENVAAGFCDQIDDAAAEPSVLRRDAADRDRGLLDRVLDVEVVRRAAQIFSDGDAVDHEQRFERRRSRDRIGAVRAGGVHRRCLQDRGIQIAGRWKRRDELLIEVGRDLRGLREHVRGRSHDRHLLG